MFKLQLMNLFILQIYPNTTILLFLKMSQFFHLWIHIVASYHKKVKHRFYLYFHKSKLHFKWLDPFFHISHPKHTSAVATTKYTPITILTDCSCYCIFSIFYKYLFPTTVYSSFLHLYEREISCKLLAFCLLQVQPILECAAALELNSKVLRMQQCQSISRI